MFKICMVGCGAIARSSHGPSVRRYVSKNPGVEFAACCDIDEERARAFKDEFGVTNYYTDMDVMLDREKPQAVCLVSPVEVTAALSCRILGRGYPLILEKPPGMDGLEARGMIEACGDVPNQVAFNRRYMPLVIKAMELIDEWGGAECILDINYRMLRVNRRDRDFATTAIHGIDLVKFLSKSNYRHIDFTYRELPQLGENVANFHLSCVMDSGAVTRLDFLPISGANTERLEINTTNGLIVLYLPIWAGCFDGVGRLCHIRDNETVLTVYGNESDEDFVLGGFYDENARFFDDVRSGRRPEGDIASGLQAVEVASCISRRMKAYNTEYGYETCKI